MSLFCMIIFSIDIAVAILSSKEKYYKKTKRDKSIQIWIVKTTAKHKRFRFY